jgi:polyhydroxybutyrate depolymerase
MRAHARTALLVLALAALAAGCRGVYARSTSRTISLDVGGRTRTCLLHVPPSYVEGRPMPLVLLLHGGGGNGAQAERAYGMDPIADREGFLVAYPNGTSRMGNLLTWNAANCCAYAYENDVDDVGFVGALLDEIERTVSVDPRRIYATGMSNGAMMTYKLGCRLSDRLAAIAPVAGSLDDESCAPSSPLSVIAFHGTADEHVPYYGGYGAASLYPHEDRPVSYAVSLWVARDACATTPVTVTSASGDVVTDTYGGGAGGAEVVLTTIRGGGHAWPGAAGSVVGDVPTQEISASELMWAFFARHAKPDASAPPAVRVASPNGGERARRGDTIDVTWSVEGTSAATEEVWLSADGGATYATRIATLDDPEARSFAWTVPGALAKGRHYRVRVVVTTRDGASGADESDADFRVKR